MPEETIYKADLDNISMSQMRYEKKLWVSVSDLTVIYLLDVITAVTDECSELSVWLRQSNVEEKRRKENVIG